MNLRITDENFDHQVQTISDYFEDTWVDRQVRSEPRRALVFPINFWNVYQRTLNSAHRTNSNIKGWQRRFQSTTSVSEKKGEFLYC